MIPRFLAYIIGRVELPVTKMRTISGRGRFGGKIRLGPVKLEIAIYYLRVYGISGWIYVSGIRWRVMLERYLWESSACR